MNHSRDRISQTHPVIGEGYRLLRDDERLMSGDETACASMLLSPEGDRWVVIDHEWEIGELVGDATGPNSPDMDAFDRVFRRKITTGNK